MSEMVSKTPELSQEVKEYLKKNGLCIQSFLGKGGFSDVYKAISGETELAVKVIKLRDQPKDIRREYLPQELKIALSVEHKYIMKTHKVIELQKDYIFMVSDFADGGDLITILDKEIHLGEHRAMVWFSQIVEAVVYLHGIGIVHRDIKPDNVLIDKGVAKLTDFGYARPAVGANGDALPTTSSCGTLEYLSPEQVICNLEDKPYDPFLSDCYSLGVLLYLMITLEFPYDCDRTVDRDEELQKLLAKQMRQKWRAKDVKRFDRDLCRLLRQLLNPDVSSRITSFQILSHPWFRRLRHQK